MKVKTFADGSFLEFDWGSFDRWCVYITAKGGRRWAPRDTDYFDFLKTMAAKYGAEKIYQDFVWIYDRTEKRVDPAVMNGIVRLAETYGDRKLGFEKVFSVLYLAMIAEENRANSRLGRRIKRLGLHVLLFEGYSTERAAGFMTKMRWTELDGLCRQRGF